MILFSVLTFQQPQHQISNTKEMIEKKYVVSKKPKSKKSYYKLITLEIDSKYYEHCFVINTKWKHNIQTEQH